MYLWQKKISVVALICVMCLSSATSADAGIIPWTYDAIFGPPGSVAARRQARRAGYYTGYAPYGYAAAPVYYGGATGGCGPCGQGQTTFYAPPVAMAPACSTCNSCNTGCSTGACSTGGCASGNCSVNYGSVPSDGETADEAGIEKADDENQTFEQPPALPEHGEGDDFVPAGQGNEGYDGTSKAKGDEDAEKWFRSEEKEEVNKVPAAESSEEEIIKQKQPAPMDEEGKSSAAPILLPADANAKITWRVKPTVNRSVRIARYSIPTVVRVEQNQLEFRVLVPEVDQQIASK